MAERVIEPKPGIYKGVQYRSQLEIKWAKWLESEHIPHLYTDSSWFDFLIDGTPIEIKPRNATLVCDAIERAMLRGGEREVVEPGTECLVIAGSPPSCYGSPILFIATQTQGSGTLLCYGRCASGSTYNLAASRDYWTACRSRQDLLREVMKAIGGPSSNGQD